MSKNKLSNDWPVQSVSDLFCIGSGEAAPYRSHDLSGPVLVYGANGSIGSYDRANYGPGYIIGRVGTTGEITKVSFRVWASDNTLTATPKVGVCDHDFGGYLLEFLNLPRLATKNAQPLLTQTNIASLCAIISENVEEQRRIAKILDTIDKGIQETEALILKLKAMKQGLLYDLLTRGLDENGKLRDPKAHPEQFKDSPLLGTAPLSWRIQKLQHFYDEPSVNGLYKPKKYYGHGPLMIHMPQMFRGLIIDTSDAARVEVNSAEIDRYGLRNGDLVFARRSLNLEGAGRCTLVNNLTETTTFESSIIRVRIRQEELLPEFVNYFLNSAIGFRLRLPLIRQVAVSGVSSGDIASIPIPCPSINEQERIIQIIEVQVSRIRNEGQYRDKLKLQKKGLMHDLLTGKVKVKV